MRVALLTCLHAFDEAYSVTRVIRDQVRMFQRAGHEVTLYVKQGFDPKQGTIPEISTLTLPGFMGRPMELVRDEFVQRFGHGALEQYDVVLCHDLWFAPMKGWDGYREGIRIVAPQTKALWIHWTHSKWRPLAGNPVGLPDHVFIALNRDAIEGISRMYSVLFKQIDEVWNPSDVTDLLSPDVQRIVGATSLLECDLLGVLPFPIGRYDSKGIDKALATYGELSKKYRVHVMLCGGRADRTKAKIELLTKHLKELPSGLRWWWAHEFDPRWMPCIPNRVVRELMGLSNLFLWPTHSEACSLAIAEARTADALVVLPDKGVEGMTEFSDADAILIPWHDTPAGAAARVEPHLERHIRRLRRRWQWSRDGIWATQMKPMLERRAKGTW
jgi:hypothetical protein